MRLKRLFVSCVSNACSSRRGRLPLRAVGISQDTKERLVAAAGEVFAERGYREATVRDICARAGANIAAIHYHFRDKAGLYEAAFAHWAAVALERYPPDMGAGPGATPKERLLAFVRSFLFRIFDRGAPGIYGRLMSRELRDPTAALDARVEETIRPLAALLISLVRAVARGRISKRAAEQGARSVVGQIVFYAHCRPVIDRLFPEQRYAPRDIERLARQVTSFSAAGIRALAALEARP